MSPHVAHATAWHGGVRHCASQASRGQDVPMQQPRAGSVSNVEMTTPMALICKALFPSISTFETPPATPTCH
jgi:hypothetical protein